MGAFLLEDNDAYRGSSAVSKWEQNDTIDSTDGKFGLVSRNDNTPSKLHVHHTADAHDR